MWERSRIKGRRARRGDYGMQLEAIDFFLFSVTIIPRGQICNEIIIMIMISMYLAFVLS